MTSMSALLVGCGKMGQALLAGWLEDKIFDDITVIEPGAIPDCFKEDERIVFIKDVAQIDFQPTVVVFAVKPQIIKNILQSYRGFENAVFVSIAAGTSIKTLKEGLGETATIIRAMPNTPSSIGKGITVLYSEPDTAPDQKKLASRVLRAGGLIEWVDDEELMHAVTALSGSGPAYVFYLIESMAKAGEEAGLEAGFAMKLARQTVIGSAALAEQDDTISAEKLRIAVTSPGGTTEAALSILMDDEDGLLDLMTRSIQKGQKRSVDLD
jgi:pyrroline-5-carboxylate reductase